MAESNSPTHSPNTESSYSINDNRIIDERGITDYEIQRLQNIAISDQLTPEQYGNYRVINYNDFNRLFNELQINPLPESGVKPGETTALSFATQLRNFHLEAVLHNVNRGNSCTIYSGTIGFPIRNWQRWIMTIKEIHFSDIYEGTTTWRNDDPLSREKTPTGFADYLRHKDPISVEVSQPRLSWYPSSHSFQPQTIEPPSSNESENEELENDELFLRTSSRITSVLPSLSGDEDRSDLLMHSHIIDQELRKLHSNLHLEVIFTDLYFNTIFILCHEYTKLLEAGNKLTRLSQPGEYKELIVFKMLKLFAMSSQPPFSTKAINTWRPTLHLELFFSNLLDSREVLKAPVIQLKYYKEGETLTPERYAEIARELFKTKDRLYSIHDLSTPTSPNPSW